MTGRLHPKRVLVAIFLILLVTGLTAVTGFHHIERFVLAEAVAPFYAGAMSGQILDVLYDQERLVDSVARDSVDGSSAAAAELAQGIGHLAALMQRLETDLAGESTRTDRDALRAEWETYRRALENLLRNQESPRTGAVETREEVRGASLALRRRLTALLAANRPDVLRSQINLREKARLYTLLTVVCTSLGMVAALFFYYRLMHLVLHPLANITGFLQNAGSGDLNRRLPRQDTADMERLANACNHLLVNVARGIEEIRRRSRTTRLIAVAVLETRSDPVLALSTSGDVLLANAAARRLATGAAGDGLLRELSQCLSEKHDTLVHGGKTYHIEKLAIPGSVRFSGSVVALVERTDVGSDGKEQGGDHDVP